MIVQLEIDVASWFDWQSEMSILNLEPVACGQHQLLSIWSPCPRIPSHGLPIVAEYCSGRAYGAEPIITEHVMSQTIVRSQR